MARSVDLAKALRELSGRAAPLVEMPSASRRALGGAPLTRQRAAAPRPLHLAQPRSQRRDAAGSPKRTAAARQLLSAAGHAAVAFARLPGGCAAGAAAAAARSGGGSEALTPSAQRLEAEAEPEHDWAAQLPPSVRATLATLPAAEVEEPPPLYRDNEARLPTCVLLPALTRAAGGSLRRRAAAVYIWRASTRVRGGAWPERCPL